jgi:hypothetical protein
VLGWGIPNDTGLGPNNVQQPITNYSLVATALSSIRVVCNYEGSNLSFVCSGLVAGIEYLFAIRALNIAGKSNPINVFKVALGTCFLLLNMCQPSS